MTSKLPAPPPIACSLSGGDVEQRRADWSALLAKTTRRRQTDAGLVLTFPRDADLARELCALVVAEQECCEFYDFSIRLAPSVTELTVRAPAAAESFVEALFGTASARATID